MKSLHVYSGETRSSDLRPRLVRFGIGLVLTRGRVGKADLAAWNFNYIYDNLAFGDWRAGRPFDERTFSSDVEILSSYPDNQKPRHLTLPDRVAGGLDSLRLSLSWLPRIVEKGLRAALVVQDGMAVDDIPWAEPFDVLFVGGTKGWKIETMATWARAAHETGRDCHVGRIGSARRVGDARTAEVDSIDSSLPLWGEQNLDPFLRSLFVPQVQMSLFGR